MSDRFTIESDQPLTVELTDGRVLNWNEPAAGMVTEVSAAGRSEIMTIAEWFRRAEEVDALHRAGG